jgi:DNA-directed RNA polymerase subunit RPC12/RpoP
MYLKVCADSSLNAATDQSIADKQAELQNIQRYLQYKDVGGKKIVDPLVFLQMADYFIGFTKESFKNFYNDPNYSIMEELLPSTVHLKMKMSTFVQVWLPYLTEENQTKLLKMTGFSLEYVEIEQPPGHTGECAHCKAEIYIPSGSFKVYCEACHKTTKVQSQFKCSSCGAENPVPDNPSKPIECAYCGVENRLIKALFG